MDHLDPDLLAAYIDGRLSPAEIAQADHHMDGCSSCRDDLSALARAQSGGGGGSAEAYCATCGQSFPPDLTHCPRDGAALVRLAARASWTGRLLDGRFEIGEPLASGGMGTVYRARQLSVDRSVAIKLVRKELVEDPATAKRFLREARLSSRLVAPGIVSIFDFGQTAEGELYLVMELVHGETLGSVLKASGQLPPERVIAIALQLCDALRVAHAAGVVHRDLKPGNIMILDDPPGRDVAKVLDFGLATSIAGDATSKLTATNALLGTPLYMAPEQITGAAVDARTDLYALGCVLYELLAGKPPFVDVSLTAVLTMHTTTPAPPLGPPVPAALAAVVARLLEKAPDARFGSAAELHEALAKIQGTAPQPAAPAPRLGHRRILAAAGGAVAIALVAGGAAYLGMRADDDVSRPDVVVRPVPRVDVRAALPPTGALRTIAIPIEPVGIPILDEAYSLIARFELSRSARMALITGSDLGELADQLKIQHAPERLAKALADRDHIAVLVVSSSLTPKGAGVAVTMSASEAGTGASVYTRTLDAASLSDVPAVTMQLALGLRDALGEQVPPDERTRPALSKSLDASYEFVLAGRLQERDPALAIEHYEHALAKDPEFPLAHVELALVYLDVGRLADGRAQQQLALRSIDHMSERDRLEFLGEYYLATTSDYDRAIDSYKQLLVKWPTDTQAETNLPIAYDLLHDTAAALAAGRRAAIHHPRDPFVRGKECDYIAETGGFEECLACTERYQHEFTVPDDIVLGTRGICAALLGKHDVATETLDKLVAIDASIATSAQAELAVAEGRWHDAEALLTRGIAADLTNKVKERAAAKRVVIAELALQRGDRAAARAAAAQVPDSSSAAFLAALVLAGSGDHARASAAAARFGAELSRTHRAMGKLIEGEVLRARGEPVKGMIAIQDALHLDDLAFGHLLLARAALDAKRFAEAYSELSVCLARRGELAGTDAFLRGGLRYDSLLFYEIAKARQGLGTGDEKAAFETFLQHMHDPDADAPFVRDARSHVQ